MTRLRLETRNRTSLLTLYGFAVKEEPPGHSRCERDPPPSCLSHVSSLHPCGAH
jgi:hypothetical protein